MSDTSTMAEITKFHVVKNDWKIQSHWIANPCRMSWFLPYREWEQLIQRTP